MRETIYARYIQRDPSKEPLPKPIDYAEGEAMRDICDKLNARLREVLPEAVAKDFEGFSPWNQYEEKGIWPKTWHWIAVYPVTGTSEGHYIHIDVLGGTRQHEHMAMSKTFGGWEVACYIAITAAQLLNA